jgi:uncharacterized membrane protein
MMQAMDKANLFVFIVTWVALVGVSFLSGKLIREIFSEYQNRRSQRALWIAVILGLIVTVGFFKQPFTEQLQQWESGLSYTNHAILVAVGFAFGWIIWWLSYLKKYGDFLQVFLLVCLIGLSWYARLAAPKLIQVFAVAFIAASLLSFAKQFIDADTDGKESEDDAKAS